MSSKTLQTLHANYEAAFNKPVPMRMKNDVRWIRKKLQEHNNEDRVEVLDKRSLEVASSKRIRWDRIL